MKKLIPLLLLVATACTKQSSEDSYTAPLAVVTSTLVVKGSLDLEVYNTNTASLGIINYRSSYELCGTSGEDLDLPVVLPMADSLAFPSSILSDGDSLTAELALEGSSAGKYNVNLVMTDNGDTLFNVSASNAPSITATFMFHNGHSYALFGTAR